MVGSASPSSSDRVFFGGFASGLDTAGLIDSLVAAQQRPILGLLDRVDRIESRQAAFGQINTSLTNLLAQLASLRDPATIGARSASTSQLASEAQKVGASASAAAAIGSFTVDVVSLATATSAASAQAVGQAVDAAAALDAAGFALPFTYGTFSINGTDFTTVDAQSTTATATAAIGATIDANATLDSAGLTVAPAASGTFSINGTAINYDATVDSLNDIVLRISGSAAGVTASYDATTRTVTLTADAAGPALITLTDDVGNFLAAVDVLAAVQTAGRDASTLTSVMADINGAGIGVTATLQNDALGRPNLLQLDGGASAVQLGSGSDTSNFLAATQLLQSPTGTVRTSVRSMGVLNPSADLSSARLATALSANSGEFSINGVSIAYDADADSLLNVISRINSSDAGVTATYDATSDTVELTADATGSTTIALADTTGNFLAAFEVLAATQALGTSASYRIDGGSLQYSTSNTVTDGVPGVSLSLLGTTTSAVTVSVAASSSAVRSRTADFVEQFNSTLELVRGHTEYSEDGDSGVLLGDGMVRGLDLTLRGMVTQPALGITGDIRSLGDIGVSFGAAGAEVGTTSLLTLDTAKFDAALADNPEAVQRLLTSFAASAALETNTGAISSVSGNPTSVTDSGLYTFDSTAAGSLTVSFQPDNGGSLQVATYSITPSEVNTTIIPGMTITFGNPIVAGTDTIRVTATEEGLAKSLHEYVESFTRTGGLMEGRESQLQGEVDDLNARIDLVNERAEAKREQLIRRFAQFEVTMQRLQNQQSALQNLVTALQPPARRR